MAPISEDSKGLRRAVGFEGRLLHACARRRSVGNLLTVVLLVASSCGARAAYAQSASQRPILLSDVGIDQKLDQQIPLDLSFHDEKGQRTPLGLYFGKRPVILALVYYECPMLCTQVLNGLMHSMKSLSFDLGKQYEVVTISINPREKPVLAAAKKSLYTGLYGRPGAAAGWHFLTSEEEPVRQLARAAGFRYAFDSASGQYAHPSAILLVTPQGKISRYFYGIEYSPRDLRLGLIEASANRIGSRVDQILLFCYHYEPVTGKYGLMISRIVQAAGLVTVLGLGAFMLAMFCRERGCR